jgi:mRNA interferase MazF
MNKNFDKWNELKKEIENNSNDLVIKEWEIWWVNIWLNIKTESCWKWEQFRRPVLIIKKLSHSSCIVIPLSTKLKSWTWFANYEINWIVYTALLYQIKMLHTNRFYVNEWKLDRKQFLEIKKRLKFLLNL